MGIGHFYQTANKWLNHNIMKEYCDWYGSRVVIFPTGWTRRWAKLLLNLPAMFYRWTEMVGTNPLFIYWELEQAKTKRTSGEKRTHEDGSTEVKQSAPTKRTFSWQGGKVIAVSPKNCLELPSCIAHENTPPQNSWISEHVGPQRALMVGLFFWGVWCGVGWNVQTQRRGVKICESLIYWHIKHGQTR